MKSHFFQFRFLIFPRHNKLSSKSCSLPPVYRQASSRSDPHSVPLYTPSDKIVQAKNVDMWHSQLLHKLHSEIIMHQYRSIHECIIYLSAFQGSLACVQLASIYKWCQDLLEFSSFAAQVRDLWQHKKSKIICLVTMPSIKLLTFQCRLDTIIKI